MSRRKSADCVCGHPESDHRYTPLLTRLGLAGCLANLKHDRCTCVTFEDEKQAQQPTRYAGRTTYTGIYGKNYRL